MQTVTQERSRSPAFARAKYLIALAIFVIVSALTFGVVARYLLPYLQFAPPHDTTVIHAQYWLHNWIGWFLGPVLGALSVGAFLLLGSEEISRLRPPPPPPGQKLETSSVQQKKAGSNGFCAYCRATTTNEPIGSISTHGPLFGKTLNGRDEPCPDCGSVVQTLWFRFLLPIVPLGKFRVICRPTNILPSEYLARRIRCPIGKLETPYDTAGIEQYY